MTKNPLINALSAILYIVLVASFMQYAPTFFGKTENIIVPIAMLSLFVFSAATMGYLFFYQPVLLILEGKKQEGVNLFLQTLAAFAACAVALAAAGLYLASTL